MPRAKKAAVEEKAVEVVADATPEVKEPKATVEVAVSPTDGFYPALARIQADLEEVEIPRIDSDNGSPLNELINVVRPIMAKHGMFIHWIGEVIGDQPVVSTVLRHLPTHQTQRFSLPVKIAEHGAMYAYPYWRIYYDGLCGILGVMSQWAEQPSAKPPIQGATSSEFKHLGTTPNVDALKLNLKSLNIDKALAVINAASNQSDLEIAVDGLVDGEAWIDLVERDAIINAVRKRYGVVRGAEPMNHGFVDKMKQHRDKLDLDIQMQELIDRQNAEDKSEKSQTP